MKYSIITPVYNVEKYLRDCIESVIAQTYSDWELILIDDGSTDDSPAICDEYAKKDSRIKSIHVENGGAYRARVLAKEYIEGGYTIGLDSDDMYEPNCLEVVEKARKETDADMIVFGMNLLEESTNELIDEPLWYNTGKMYTKKQLLEESLILREHSLGNKVVKSEIYKNTNYINEEYRLSLGLDYLQVVPLLCGIKEAYVIKEKLYIYRMRSGSITHSYKFSNIVDNDWLSCKLRDYLKREGLYSEKMNYALEHSYMDIFISRLYALRWKITTKERKRINELPFLNSMTNDIGSLVENRGKRALVHYMKRGVWGPNGIIYKVFLKYYVKPLKRKG